MPTSPVAQGQRHKVEDRGKGVAPLPPANTTSTSDTPLPLPLLVSPVAGLDSGGRIPESRATKHPAGMMINDTVVYIHSRVFLRWFRRVFIVCACCHSVIRSPWRTPRRAPPPTSRIRRPSHGRWFLVCLILSAYLTRIEPPRG